MDSLPDEPKTDPELRAAKRARFVLEESSIRAARVLEEAAIRAHELIEKAHANGFATRQELAKERQSINSTTWASWVATLAVVAGGVWFVVQLMITPIQANQTRFETALIDIQKDIRSLYQVSVGGRRSERLERPVEPMAK